LNRDGIVRAAEEHEAPTVRREHRDRISVPRCTSERSVPPIESRTFNSRVAHVRVLSDVTTVGRPDRLVILTAPVVSGIGSPPFA
jgi:hypothetical protein